MFTNIIFAPLFFRAEPVFFSADHRGCIEETVVYSGRDGVVWSHPYGLKWRSALLSLFCDYLIDLGDFNLLTSAF